MSDGRVIVWTGDEEEIYMGSKDKGTKESRKPKTAKKKEKDSGPVIKTRVKPRVEAGEKSSEE